MTSNIATLTLQEFFANKAAPKILTMCGSQRVGSFNKMLHDYANKTLEKHGAIVTPIDLGALNLPLFNPDDEPTAFPEAAKILKAQLVATDGIFIASPEYNGNMSPLLLNAITWATRGEGDMYAGFKGKVAAVMATSPGPMGGLRMVRSLNQMLHDMGCTVLSGSNAIGNSYKVFDNDGCVNDEYTKAKIEATCANLVHFCRYEANREQECAVAREFFKLNNMGEYGQVDLPK